MSVHKKIDTSKFQLMYNTYLYDQNRRSIFNVFCTGLKKNLQLIRSIGNMIGYKKEPLRVAVSLRSQDGKMITNSPNAAAKNSGAISERSFSEKNCKEFEVIIIYSA